MDAESLIKSASDAVTGSGTPASAQISAPAEDKVSKWARMLAGPAISFMVAGIIAILSFGMSFKLWTPASEIARVHYVGGIGVALSLMIGVIIWRLDGSKLNRLEVKMGPGSFTMGDNHDAPG